MREVGWVLVEATDNEYGVEVRPYLGTELVELPPGRHPLFIADAAGAQEVLARTLSKVAEHLRSGIALDYDPETGQASHRSQWDCDADQLVSEALHALATFSPERG
jgi:hypothetical protein